jgi:PAS domain-containing protein
MSSANDPAVVSGSEFRLPFIGLASAVIVFVALILPATQLSTAYDYERTEMTAHAQTIAGQLSDVARARPGAFNLDADLLNDYLVTPHIDEHVWQVSLIGINDRSVHEPHDTPQVLRMHASAEIAGNTGPIGTVLITASMTMMLLESGYALALGLCIGLAMALVFRGIGRRNYISGRQSLIDSQIEQRRAEERAGSAQRQLSAAVEVFTDVFVLLDADDRIVPTNDAWRTIYAAIPHAAAPGTSFEGFLRESTAAGLYPDAVGHEAEWMDWRMALHQKLTAPFELARADGRWSLVNEQRLPDGGTILIASDITERKLAQEN